MSIQRGDVVLVSRPFGANQGSKRRPAVVVQNNQDNGRLSNTILAMITSVTHRAKEPTRLLMDVSTPDGAQTGLRQNSVVNCCNLLTIEQTLIIKTIGTFSATLMQQIDQCLKTALEL